MLHTTPQCQAQLRFAEVRSRASHYKIGSFPPLRNAKLNYASLHFARVLRTIKIERASWKKKGHLFPRRPFYFCIAQLYLEHHIPICRNWPYCAVYYHFEFVDRLAECVHCLSYRILIIECLCFYVFHCRRFCLNFF